VNRTERLTLHTEEEEMGCEGENGFSWLRIGYNGGLF
jgi:hypothetical protein